MGDLAYTQTKFREKNPDNAFSSFFDKYFKNAHFKYPFPFIKMGKERKKENPVLYYLIVSVVFTCTIAAPESTLSASNCGSSVNCPDTKVPLMYLLLLLPNVIFN